MSKEYEAGEKTVKRFQEVFRKKKYKKKNRLNPEEEKRLDAVALQLSEKFFLDKLIKASDQKKAGLEGRDVHGFMEKEYPDYYWLIDHDVLDRACYYAFIHFQQIHYCTLENYDLKNMHQSLVTWEKKVSFDHFPEFKFNRAVLLSLEPLNEAITFIDNYEPYELEGYETGVRLGPANLLNGGFPIWDLPICIVKDSVGKDKFFFQAKTTSEELTKERDDLLKKEIFEMRQKEKMSEEKIEELEIESSTARKMYADLKHKMLSRSPFSDEYEFEQFERDYIRKQHGDKLNYKKILIGLGIAVLILFLFIGCIFLFSPRPETISTPETSSLGAFIDIGKLYFMKGI